VQVGIFKALTPQQLQRCLVVKIDVMKWICQYFGHPDQARSDIMQDEQMHCTKKQG
jgi:hypothetical protein